MEQAGLPSVPPASLFRSDASDFSVVRSPFFGQVSSHPASGAECPNKQFHS